MATADTATAQHLARPSTPDCAKGDEKVDVTRGHTIPKCPNGHSEFDVRRNEPGNKS